MVVDYKSRKNEVLTSYNTVEKLITELQAYAKKIGLPDPTERLGNLLSDIRSKAEKVKTDRFKIMIAGESKSGKSTFINAYLGEELLPMDVKQCTSAIVEIKWGEKFSVKATYANGRIEEINGYEEARAFLKKNAALDDEYRDIPVPTINNEILVKSGLRSREKGSHIVIHKAEVEAMLKAPEVQSANIHNLPNYNERIREYINARKNNWQDIVTKIEIVFPFGDDLRGIEIIDSPGICARGGVAEITSKYIENADAIIFLKPVTGQSLESTQFNQFMENISVERNKNALFLVFTYIATKNDADLRRLEEEAKKQFSGKLYEENILFVDSKAELFAKKFSKIEDVNSEYYRLKKEGSLDDFVKVAYGDSDSDDPSDFITKLQQKSRFIKIYHSLDVFGRKAHYILLRALLESINKLYNKLWNNINSSIDMFKHKVKDPTELAKKIAEVKKELDEIQNQLSRGVDTVVRGFLGDEGKIRKEANKAVDDFLSSVKKISPNADDAFSQLEKLSLTKIDYFKTLTKQLQNQVVADFDEKLFALSNKSTISFKSLNPDFTEETFKEIKESTKSKALETRLYEEGLTFKKPRTQPVYVQNKHFKIIKNNILRRLDDLKYDLVCNLEDFLENIRKKYMDELSSNADAKKRELDAIMDAKTSAEQTLVIIQELSAISERISAEQENVNKIKGGITKNVQHNN